MFERDYYPPGAYSDPNAPYNQREPEYRVVDAVGDVSISLSHTDVPMKAEAIIRKETIEEANCVEEYEDFIETNTVEAYEESPYYILTLLKEYASVLEAYKCTTLTIIDRVKEDYKDNVINKEKYDRRMKSLDKELSELDKKIKACEDWCVDDVNVCI